MSSGIIRVPMCSILRHGRFCSTRDQSLDLFQRAELLLIGYLHWQATDLQYGNFLPGPVSWPSSSLLFTISINSIQWLYCSTFLIWLFTCFASDLWLGSFRVLCLLWCVYCCFNELCIFSPAFSVFGWFLGSLTFVWIIAVEFRNIKVKNINVC